MSERNSAVREARDVEAGRGANVTRRAAIAAMAGVAAAAGLAGRGTQALAAGASDKGGAASSAADSAASDGKVVGTRYTQATNSDEIGIVHDAATTEDADVVVVGTGISGVVCAMITAEQAPDAKVIVVEARSICGGGTNFAEQADMPAPGLDRTAALQYGDEAAAKSHYVKDGALIAELHYELGRNSAWMFGKHAVPLQIKSMAKLKEALDEGGAIRIQPIASYDGGCGAQTIENFIDEIGSEDAYKNVEVRTSTRATALLLQDEYDVTGVQVLNADGTYTNINAKAVVLSCGGMSNNLELLQNYSNQELSHCVSVDQGHHGDGMVMVEQTAHGRCKTIALSSMLGYVDGFDYQSWLGLAAGDNPSALFVNETGRRFANEDTNAVDTGDGAMGIINNSKMAEGQGRVYSIMGQGLYDYYKENGLFTTVGFYSKGQEDRPFDLDADVEEYKDNPNFFQADTLEELASKIDVPADALKETVEQYDADAQAGTGDSVFLKDAKYMIALGDAPYYAFKLSSLIVNTNAGIRVNTNCQVVDQDKKVVNGLYATGIAISGFVTDVYEVGNCQCVSIWSGSKAARTLVEKELGGTVADDWYGDSEWQADQLPTFSNWSDYEAYVASASSDGATASK